MTNKKLSIIPIVLLSIIIIISIAYTIKQYSNVKKCLEDSTKTILNTSVEASYDIIDATVNESIRNYLKGIAFTIKNMVEISHTNPPPFDRHLLNNNLDQLIKNIHIGKNGYISIINPQGTLISHPFMMSKDISNIDIIKKQLSLSESFFEYPWKNPNDTSEQLKLAYTLKLHDGCIIHTSVYKDEIIDLIDKEVLKKKLSMYSFEQAGYVFVFNTKGKLILHPLYQGKSIHDIAGANIEKFITRAKKEHQGTFSYHITMPDGNIVLKTAVYKYYPNLDWVIAAGIPQKDLNESTNLLWDGLLLTLLSLILVIIGLTWGLRTHHNRILMEEKKDFLTGLNNRRSFMEYSKELNLKSNYSIIIFDIDSFKSINDRYGHDEGDKVIKAVADIFKKFESEHILVSRYGGEEFVLLLNKITKNQAYLIAELIRYKVANISHLQIKFTISAGIYECTTVENSLAEAIFHADKALYKAKESGRNKAVIYQEYFKQVDSIL